jgi:MIP family channel proteins
MDRKLIAALVAEGVGTCLFFIVGAGSIVLGTFAPPGPGLLGIALAHGLILAVVVSSLGAVSGGHVNPAVTFGLWIAGKIEATRAVLYVVAQLIGAAAAGFVLRLVFPDAWQATNIGVPALGAGVSPATGIALEAIMTVVLLLAVFGTAVDPRGPKIGGFAIGLAISADILVGGPVTGAAMNPARWFGPAVASGFFDNAYVWIVGPLLGAALAAIAYRWLFSPEATAD